jgi:hypothetical protein
MHNFILDFGKATTERTKIGLIFAKTPPKTPLVGTALINGALHIPAGDPDARVDAEMTSTATSSRSVEGCLVGWRMLGGASFLPLGLPRGRSRFAGRWSNRA